MRILKFGGWLGLTLIGGAGLAADFADAFADRETLTGETEIVFGSNGGATVEPGEPRHADKPGGHSVWVSWVAPTNGLVTLSTDGSTLDTLLAVYTLEEGDDPPLQRLHEVAESDDEGTSSFATVQFGALAGTRYEIAVDGFAGTTGDVALTVSLQVLTNLLPSVVRHPGDQALREGDTLILTVDIDRRTAEAFDLHWYFNGVKLTNEEEPTLVITNLQVTNVGQYRIRLEMEDAKFFSAPVEIQINSEGQTNVLARNKLEDASTSGLTSGGSGGRLALRVRSSVGGGVNRGYNGSQVFNTSLATRDPLEPEHCGVPGGPTYWFSYQPPVDGVLHLDTDGSDYDTLLAVYTYDPPLLGYASLIPVACDNNSGADGLTSRLEFQASSTRAYFIVVDGVNGARGIARLNYQLALSNAPPAEPSVLRQPRSWTVAVGNTIALDVLANGLTPLTYQWFCDEMPLPGQTNATLTLHAVQPTSSGLYQVGISNNFGWLLSDVAAVHVLSAPTIQVDTSAGVARLVFPATRGFQYRLEMSKQVPTNAWSLVTNALTDSGGVIRLNHPMGAARSRFYRLVGP